MRSLAPISLFVAVLAFAGPVLASDPNLNNLTRQAVSSDGRESATAIAALRSKSSEGLSALFETYSADIRAYSEHGIETEKWPKIAAVLDAVAMQKDAYASGLYWHTDMTDARKAARASGKPILTLRLLGNLNEEFSCANSRLFRSLLYSNPDISKYLRDNFVLHWKSVRPAPKITIDFGDGRKIERTVTGNSIHYVIDADGRVLEALPGLYSPKAFLIYLTQAKQLNDAIAGKPWDRRDIAVMRYRKASFDALKAKRDKAIEVSKISLKNDDPQGLEWLPAYGASWVAVTKMVVTDEITLLRFYDNFQQYQERVDFSEWQRLADIYSPSPELADASVAFVRRQTMKSGLTAGEFDRMLAKVRAFVGLDTTRNDFLFHTQLYSKLNTDAAASRGRPTDLEAFNAWVYAELFKTPDSDKWLGLYSTDVYTALDGNGIVK